MDFIKQNLVIVACIAAVVLFLLLAVPVIMWAGGNEQKQRNYYQQVAEAQKYAGHILERTGLINLDTRRGKQYALDEQRLAKVQLVLSGLAGAKMRTDTIASSVRDKVRDAFGQADSTLTQALASLIEQEARRGGVSPDEAVGRLRARLRGEVGELVRWKEPVAEGKPIENRLNIKYNEALVAATTGLMGKGGEKGELEEKLDEVVQIQVDRARRGMLIDGLFPSPSADSERKRTEFQNEYRKKIEQLAHGVKYRTALEAEVAKLPPSDPKRKALEEQLHDGLKSGMPLTATELGDLTGTGAGPRITIRDFDPPNPFPGLRIEKEMPTPSPYDPFGATVIMQPSVTTGQERMTRQQELQLSHSATFRIYLADGKEAFGIDRWVHEPFAPEIEKAWYGQVKLWILQDLVDAVKATNDESAQVRKLNVPAEKLPVAQSIVKHLKGIQVGPRPAALLDAVGSADVRIGAMGPVFRPGGDVENPYALTADAQRATAGGRPVPPGQQPAATLTGRTSCRFYDATYAAIRVVIDARCVGRLIHHVDSKGFFTILNARVGEVDQRGARNAGFWYGPQPLIDLTLVYEVLLFRQAFQTAEGKSLLPDKVVSALDWKPPTKPEKSAR